MKNKKLIYALSLASVVGGMNSACSDDFLKEELTTAQSTDYFKSSEGIDELVIGAYQKLKFKFNYVWAIQCHGMGIDEFTDANNQMPAWNHYGDALNSVEGSANQPMWDNYYGLVEPANVIIANVPQYYDESKTAYNTRLGEGYFLRAYAYFELVKQFGAVPLKLKPSVSVETVFKRNTEEECYAQIIADFEQAYKLLPDHGSIEKNGRISKQAAAHFLAKAHLFRASELYAGWNSSYKEADLNAVITLGQEVVTAHPLCANFVDLWDFQQADGANESATEVVLAAQFSDDQTTWGRFGNQMHLYYPSVYQDMGGTKRDISGGREFSYVSATQYTMQVFDRVNDSRFWKSFITCYGCNDTKTAPEYDSVTVTDYKVRAGVEKGTKRFKGGDVAIKYIVNNAGDARYKLLRKGDDAMVTRNDTVMPERYFVNFFEGEGFQWNLDPQKSTGNYYYVTPHKRSVALSKFRDGYRNAIASQFGTRDAILARSADDVLMVAEAYARKGDFGNAITWINKLRERAGYAEGEDRGVNIDGGQSYKNNTYCSGKGGGFSAEGAIYSEKNTYYESNDLEATKPTSETKSAMTLGGLDAVLNSAADMPIYEALGCTSDADKMMCFILNERTRELCGELYRWEDLARTKTLGARWRAFNDGVTRGIGKFDDAKHYYRPIPQSFIDGLTVSDAEKAKLQNPGY